MNARTKMFSILGLSVALVATAAALADDKDKATGKDKKGAKVGEAAPAWTLKDTKGADHKLADYAGKIVVIEWFNPGCPYCKGVYEKGVVKNTIDELKKVDPNVVYIAVNSTANKPKDEVTAESDSFLTAQKMTNIPVMMDYEGTTGRAYGAKTTPHMFVIDTTGVLRYAGAFIEKAEKTDSQNYVVNAVKQIKAGETVAPSETKPWGCSVKYAKSNNEKNQGQGGDKSGGKGTEKSPN